MEFKGATTEPIARALFIAKYAPAQVTEVQESGPK